MLKTSLKPLICIFCCLLGLLFISSAAQASGKQPQDTPQARTPKVDLTQPNMQQAVGHPGTAVTITGKGFTPSGTVNLFTITDNTQCIPNGTGQQPFTGSEAVTVKADGTFVVKGTWPANANTATTAYFVCAISSTTSGEQAVSPQSFTVAQDVTAIPSSTNANPGDTITITGDNWLPPQQLHVTIAPDATPTQSIVAQDVNADQMGHFSVKLKIPADTAPGTYTISVTATNEATLTYQKADVITVNSAATPTPTVGPTPTVTPTPTPAPTATPTQTAPPPGNTGGSSGGGSGTTILIYGLGGLGVLMVVVGLIMFAASSPARAH